MLGFLRDRRWKDPAAMFLVGFVVAGMLAAKLLSALTPNKPTKNQGVLLVSLQVIWPWLVVLLVATATALLLRYTSSRHLALGLGVLVVFGVCSVWVPETVLTTWGDKVCVSGPERPECRHPRRQIPAGGAEVARYIREHSAINGPFWDRDLLAANDRVFHNPTRADLDHLRTKYDVRWLVFDTLLSRPSARLKDHAVSRFAAGTVELYELPPPRTEPGKP